MYNILIENIKDKYDYNELIKIFLRPDQYRLFTEDEPESPAGCDDVSIVFNEHDFGSKDHIKREIYKGLSQLTGLRPPWGILTGVRPVKLTGELFEKLGSEKAVTDKLTGYYLLSEEKARLLTDVYRYQQETCGDPPENSAGLYIGIPFCPTRCLYCSFTSNQEGPGEIEAYLDALYREIEYAGRAAKDRNMLIESVYIGGGTPTTLTWQQLDTLIRRVQDAFDLSSIKEFTVEAGRPDTITEDKLAVLMDRGIDRISINPQTMKDETLEMIGRSHKADDIRKAFGLAQEAGDFIINADLIAGLPGEDKEDFESSLREMIGLGPQNITVHTLAVKKASRLIEKAPDYHYDHGTAVQDMLAAGKKMLSQAGYRPYYLYRQKHMAGALENVGYCKGNTPSVYNIRIMEEKQNILALGAGGISKRYYLAENRLERVPNVSNYRVYIDRLDQMISRKNNNFFGEV